MTKDDSSEATKIAYAVLFICFLGLAAFAIYNLILAR